MVVTMEGQWVAGTAEQLVGPSVFLKVDKLVGPMGGTTAVQKVELSAVMRGSCLVASKVGRSGD